MTGHILSCKVGILSIADFIRCLIVASPQRDPLQMDCITEAFNCIIFQKVFNCIMVLWSFFFKTILRLSQDLDTEN